MSRWILALLVASVALVHAQLEPIQTREALIESYRREAICRIVIPALSSGSAVEVLELAYAMRWMELDDARIDADQSDQA